MNFEHIIQKKDNSITAKIIRAVLTPFSWLYNLAHIIFFIPYKLGIRKLHKASLPIICVGNISMGGTGKTPFVVTLINILKENNYKPVILSRGYNRKNTEQENLLFTPESNLTVEETGDEPQLLMASCQVPIVIGRNRIKSLNLIPKECDIIVLDDGMQYWQLYKDIIIAIQSAKMPFASGQTIPAGDLREPKSGLKRADFIVLTETCSPLWGGKSQETLDYIQNYCPKSFVYKGITAPTNIYSGKEKLSLDYLKNKNVFAFTGIGNPERFIDTLKSLGANVVMSKFYPDHYNYTEADFNELNEIATENNLTITTQKDIVKLPNNNFLWVEIGTNLNNDFKEKLIQKLNEVK